MSAENALVFLANWRMQSDSISIALRLPFGLVATALCATRLVSLVCGLLTLVPTLTRNRARAAFAALVAVFVFEAALHASTGDFGGASRSALALAVACAARALELASSIDRRVYSGFVGDARSPIVDSTVGLLRQRCTRYRVSALAQIACAVLVLYALVSAESVVRGAALRRQLGRATWRKTASAVSLLSSFAVFDRSDFIGRKRL